MGAPNASGRVG